MTSCQTLIRPTRFGYPPNQTKGPAKDQGGEKHKHIFFLPFFWQIIEVYIHLQISLFFVVIVFSARIFLNMKKASFGQISPRDQNFCQFCCFFGPKLCLFMQNEKFSLAEVKYFPTPLQQKAHIPVICIAIIFLHRVF